MPNSRRHSWKISAVGAVVLAASVHARAEEATPAWQALGLSGTIRGGAFSHDFSFDRGAPAGAASIWFTAEPQRFWGVKVFVDGRLQAESLQNGARLSGDLREAYLKQSFGGLDVKVGRQIIVWGRADKVNPTDIWSVRDVTLLTTDNEDQRLGAAAAQANWRIGPVSLIGVWQPEWRTAIFPIPPLPGGLAARRIDPADPAAQFGFKADHSGEGVDWSVSYGQVIDKTPDLRFAASSVVDILYRPIEMYGADAAVPVGRYGLRGEIAYTRQRRQAPADTAPQYDNLFLVAGAERTFGGELNINLQYLYRRNFGFRAPASVADPTRRFLFQEEDILANQPARDMNGMSARVSDRFLNETLQVELSGVVWFVHTGGTIGPKLSYALNDRLQLIVGGEIYFGPKTGFWGEFKHASNIHSEVRWGF